MESPAKSFETLIGSAEVYAKTSIELTKLKAIEATIEVSTSAISMVSVVAVLSLFIFFVNLGLAFLFGELLGAIYLGFMVVASFYLLAAIILHFFLPGWIKKPLTDFILSKFLS